MLGRDLNVQVWSRSFRTVFLKKNLGLMFDALEELADLTLALQKADISLHVAHRMISSQIEVFVARKDNGKLLCRGMQVS